LRLSGDEFNLDEDDENAKYIHLTNNAVQKFNMNYNQSDGNQMTFKEYEVHNFVKLEGIYKIKNWS